MSGAYRASLVEVVVVERTEHDLLLELDSLDVRLETLPAEQFRRVREDQVLFSQRYHFVGVVREQPRLADLDRLHHQDERVESLHVRVQLDLLQVEVLLLVAAEEPARVEVPQDDLGLVAGLEGLALVQLVVVDDLPVAVDLSQPALPIRSLRGAGRCTS